MPGRFPAIEPHDAGMLDVGDGQRSYREVSGNPEGSQSMARRRAMAPAAAFCGRVLSYAKMSVRSVSPGFGQAVLLGWAMSSGLHLYISEEGADGERLDALSRYLRADLAELDVDDVAALPAGAAPPGTRSGTAAAVGALLVNLGDAASGLASVVAAVRAWLGRGQAAPCTVRLELDGDVLELARPSTADQERLVELFLSRHQPRPGG